ncbi:MAG TPA: hypothetical protein VLG50_06045 [Candidatus Saccharimonadales bacterium]|nr:hypothetical protein [Candidatus Saccharimonadales bacterium]
MKKFFLIMLSISLGSVCLQASYDQNDDDFEERLALFTPAEPSYSQPSLGKTTKPSTTHVTASKTQIPSLYESEPAMSSSSKVVTSSVTEPSMANASYTSPSYTSSTTVPTSASTAPIIKSTLKPSLFQAPEPKAEETYWDKIKNYLNVYQWYKNYRQQETKNLLNKYGLQQEQLDVILFNHPDFMSYSGHAQDSIVAFAKREQDLTAKNFELDNMLRYTVEPMFQRISNDIRLLNEQTTSVGGDIAKLQSLRAQIKNLEDQQIKILAIMQESQEQVIKVKLDTLDKLSKPLALGVGTQTLLTGAPQPNRNISPFRPQAQSQQQYRTQPQQQYQQELYRANTPSRTNASARPSAQAARSADDVYWQRIEEMGAQPSQYLQPKRVVRFDT